MIRRFLNSLRRKSPGAQAWPVACNHMKHGPCARCILEGKVSA